MNPYAGMNVTFEGTYKKQKNIDIITTNVEGQAHNEFINKNNIMHL